MVVLVAGERQAVARRAYAELFNTGKARPVINYGVGVPDAVAKLIAARNEQHRIYQTIEHGTYGGTLMDGVLFGYARNATAMLDAATQFDFYGGGGLDIAFLGFGEFDEQGNVNVSRLGGVTVGPVLMGMGIDPIWLGVLISLNLQTSFLTPPLGPTLFYIQSVLPEGVTSQDVYRGIAPFVAIQLLAIGVVAAFPALATWLPAALF